MHMKPWLDPQHGEKGKTSMGLKNCALGSLKCLDLELQDKGRPGFGELTQEGNKREAGLGFLVRPCLRKLKQAGQ